MSRRPSPLRALACPLVLWVVAGVGPIGCGDSAATDPDAGRDGHVPVDARLDGATTDGAVDAAPPVPRDAAALPCEAPGWFSPVASRIRTLEMSDSGQVGAGLNLDSLSTCAPQNDCDAGVDNQGAAMHVTGCTSLGTIEPGGLNYLLRELILNADPPESFILEARDLVLAGTDSVGTFRLLMQHGRYLPSPDCPDRQDVIDGVEACDYVVDDVFYEPGTCTPLSTFDNARLTGGLLEAGGPGYTLWLVYQVPLYTTGFVLHDAKVEAQVRIEGNRVYVESGILAGVICPTALASATASIVAADTQCILAGLPPPDLEAGCDPQTSPDGISTAFLFTASPARIVGFVGP